MGGVAVTNKITNKPHFSVMDNKKNKTHINEVGLNLIPNNGCNVPSFVLVF